MIVPAQEAPAQVERQRDHRGFYDELSRTGSGSTATTGNAGCPAGSARIAAVPNGEWIYTKSVDLGLERPLGGRSLPLRHVGLHRQVRWVWVPGTVWPRAWVTWSYSDSYVGWAADAADGRLGRSG